MKFFFYLESILQYNSMLNKYPIHYDSLIIKCSDQSPAYMQLTR